MHTILRFLLSLPFFILTGCGSELAVPLTENLTLVVKEVSATDSSFKALFSFRETTDYEAIIQEVEIQNASGLDIVLVESFDTTWWDVPVSDREKDIQGTVTDQHWSGVARGWERRNCRFYAGKVLGADKDSVGFAMLPQNYDGSVVTRITDKVNQRYRKRQKIQDKIVERHPETAAYSLEWIPGKLVVSSHLGSIVHENGKNRLVRSEQVISASKERNRDYSIR